MRGLSRFLSAGILGVALTALAPSIMAQGFNFDARAVGMGSVGDTSNMATRLAGPRAKKSYRTIGLPFGLIQVFKDTSIYDPTDDNFNPVRAMQNAVSPLHYTFKRDEGGKAEALVKNIVDGDVSTDLNAYRGFLLRPETLAGGVVAPSWGKSFRVSGNDRVSHHVFVGAGPYLTVTTDLDIDQSLIDLWASSTNQSIPNQTFRIQDVSEAQVAGAITGGYRVRLPLPGGSANMRDGIYVGANYNYLRGVRYESIDIGVRFDTGANGLLIPVPGTPPAVIDRTEGKEGTGYSIDIAGGLVMGPWEVNLSAFGVTNRMDWERMGGERYTLTSLVNDFDFVESSLAVPTTRRVEVPTRYAGGVAYYDSKWSAQAQYENGLQGNAFQGGGEYSLGFIDLRAGGRYTRRLWNPTAGIGLNLTKGFGVDFGAFGMPANIETRRKVAVAVSLRLNRNEPN